LKVRVVLHVLLHGNHVHVHTHVHVHVHGGGVGDVGVELLRRGHATEVVDEGLEGFGGREMRIFLGELEEGLH
jgi:hypothetical protein